MPYSDGQFGQDLGGKRIALLDAFAAKQSALINAGSVPAAVEQGLMSAEEAMSVADFGTYMAAIVRTTFLGAWDEVQGQWGEYTRQMSLVDFEEYSSYRWGRFPDWPQRPLNSDVEQLAIKEFPGAKVKLIEWAAGFTITRQLILADREDRIANLPAALGEAGARTQTKRAISQLEANPAMFDGNNLFSAQHANTGTTALTADVAGANAIKVALDAIDTQTDDEGYKIVNGTGRYVLVVPRALMWVANTLRDRDVLPLDVASGTSVLRANEVAGRFDVVVERFLTDTNNWYLFSDPQGPRGTIAALNLNGNTRPQLFQKDDRKVGILGSGEDPYSWRWDQLEYMGRHDFDFLPVEWRTAYGSIVP